LDTNRLKALPLFESVSDEDLEKIAPFVSEVSVSEGKHLVEEGDYAYEFMAIEEGIAEVRRGDRILAELGPGDFFGEMGLIEPTAATPP
jgi:CRP-like cAMP-binding protein